MPTTRNPRRGSLQFWPRRRAKREYARLRSNPKKYKGLQAFPGYKVGMTHVQYLDTFKTSLTKNETISTPCTIIECPPIKIFSVRFYKRSYLGLKVSKEIRVVKGDKFTNRRIKPMKKDNSFPETLEEDVKEIRVCIITQPSKTGLEKKKPEIFEVFLGGGLEEQFNFVKDNINKEISLLDVFKEGQIIDLHGVTKGRGFQGVVKRHGVKTKRHKSEKGTRHALAGSEGMMRVMYTSPRTGKHGYHLRTQYNNWILKILEKPEFKPFEHYGIPKNPCVLVKGSVQGPYKRIITMSVPMRPVFEQKHAPEIKNINKVKTN